MLLVYASRTGKVQSFINKLDFPSMKITDDLTMDEPYILLTYTDKKGKVPEIVEMFLRRTRGAHLKGVAASGHTNWGDNFALSANIISRQYRVPVVHKFENDGMDSDVEYFKKRVEEIQDEPCGVKQ